MMVLKVVSAAFLLLAAGAVAGEKPTTLDRSPVNTTREREGIRTPHQPSSAPIETLQLQNQTKNLHKKEIPINGHLNSNIAPSTDDAEARAAFNWILATAAANAAADDAEARVAFNWILATAAANAAAADAEAKAASNWILAAAAANAAADDAEAMEAFNWILAASAANADTSTAKNGRTKRKVIFGGGSYGHTGRRGGAAVGGDPYGRRRDPHGPHSGPYESWPYNPPGGESYSDSAVKRPAEYITTTRRPDYVIIAPTTHPTYFSSGSNSGSSSSSSASGILFGRNYRTQDRKRILIEEDDDEDDDDDDDDEEEEEEDGIEGKEVKSKKKFPRHLKWEIAKFALQHGIEEAAERYTDILERRLSSRKVKKFVKRYQKKYRDHHK